MLHMPEIDTSATRSLLVLLLIVIDDIPNGFGSSWLKSVL